MSHFHEAEKLRLKVTKFKPCLQGKSWFHCLESTALSILAFVSFWPEYSLLHCQPGWVFTQNCTLSWLLPLPLLSCFPFSLTGFSWEHFFTKSSLLNLHLRICFWENLTYSMDYFKNLMKVMGLVSRKIHIHAFKMLCLFAPPKPSMDPRLRTLDKMIFGAPP